MRGTQIETLKGQIGRMNILGISGGRSMIQDGKLVLPVSSGYRVLIGLDEGSDTYTVERVMVRGAKTFQKGIVTNVYCSEVGEVAYQAGMYKSYDFGGVSPR